ncbi:MAG: YebC/PmpR family DNA-binding transcriptional regulator [Sphingosinicella sp.]
MAGHSKFKNIMYRKGAQDKKRSNLFSKLAREITVAAKMGLPDPDANPRLRAAVNAARAQSMPKDNIQRAIDKASGGDAENYEEMRYEGFGPGGVSLVIEALTDNRNRTATNLRTIFSKNGGNLGASGAVTHGFERLGLVTYKATAGSADAVFEAAIEAGAEDVESDEDEHDIWTAQDNLHEVARGLEQALGPADSVGLAWRARSSVEVAGAEAEQLVRLVETLEEDDDIQTVWGNYEMSEEVMERLA